MTYRIPNEFARQDRVFTCWPADGELWLENLEPARAEFAAFLKLLMAPGEHGERLAITVLAANGETEVSIRAAMGDGVEILPAPYGDVWARDTGPVFALDGTTRVAVTFRFNGWGGKYELPGDDRVAAAIADAAGALIRPFDLVAEGGALEFDGDGTVLTTRQCLLNPNRNPGKSEAEVEAILKAALGVEKVLWLDEGLKFDHTDGHIDNVARFAGPGRVVCQAPAGPDDPQADILDQCAGELEAMTDARGRKLEVLRIPSPGRIEDEDGNPRPASHMNWVIGPRNLVVPTYGTPEGDEAVTILQGIFPTRQVIGSPSSHILSGGGAFHCVTCHVPSGD
ncbi:agmatine deiminase family protein [Hyphobacterium marinum]|uniref:Agmatine deiminase family protein n=1 Tax=Hyphobacterium marinum TaxID=3116574 RepID=A0ABU7LW04_9PROT|nr:agmatine deiminase family protein [Hyphobacterium sp. Y6023]MEE2565736.1 agmatine deiminase family protein [Hyphobacterium sp. Y6023]